MRGYKSVLLCEDVRDELAANLSIGSADTEEAERAITGLLLGMLDRRLLPTPWLNQVCALRVN